MSPAADSGPTPDAGPGGPSRRPVLRVVSGDATPEEIAAILAVVAARSGAGPGAGTDRTRTSTWASPRAAHRGVRASFVPGPHGWRTSYWPR